MKKMKLYDRYALIITILSVIFIAIIIIIELIGEI